MRNALVGHAIRYAAATVECFGPCIG